VKKETFSKWWRKLVAIGKREGWTEDTLGDKSSYRDAYNDGLSPGDAFGEMVTSDI